MDSLKDLVLEYETLLRQYGFNNIVNAALATHADRASAEGLREAIDAALHELGEPGPGYPAPVANAVDILRAALRSSESDSGIDVERLRRAVFNIDHATPGVGWVEDVVEEYARLSTPHTETSDRIENGWSEYDAPPPGDSDR